MLASQRPQASADGVRAGRTARNGDQGLMNARSATGQTRFGRPKRGPVVQPIWMDHDRDVEARTGREEGVERPKDHRATADGQKLLGRVSTEARARAACYEYKKGCAGIGHCDGITWRRRNARRRRTS